MDPQATSFSGRRRSSVIDPDTPLSLTSSSPTPRRPSAWDDPPPPSSTTAPTASDISSRRPSETTTNKQPSSHSISIATRKASAWDEDNGDISIATSTNTRVSVSDIAGRRATDMDRPPWDLFSGAPPPDKSSTWGWMAEIVSMTSPTTGDGPTLTSDRNRVYYAGNMNYIFENYNNQSLTIAGVEALMYAYGVEKTSVEYILSNVDPQKSGIFNMNSHNKQILVASTINFSPPKEPLSNVRHASKCFGEKLLSPLHFAGYIIDFLKGKYIGNEPPFMILGMYSILGVLKGSAKRELTTKDVEKFVRLWKVTNPDEVQDLVNMIKDDLNNGTFTCWDFYNLLYRRNLFGKQRIEMFDTQGQQNPSMFFPLIDKDEDGFLSSADLHSFAAIFGRYPSDEAIECVTCKLDIDGDGKISLDDFRRAMEPIFDGMTWDFWIGLEFFAITRLLHGWQPADAGYTEKAFNE